jgi:hypothetical protein
MSHPIYSRQQLLNRGLVKVKKIAADLGVLPTGDKRLIQNWIDAIVEHQAAQISKIQTVEATIDFDNESYEGLTEPYMVLVGGEIVHRAATYQQAERYCKWHSLTLVDSQTLAQSELETEMEVQSIAATEAENIQFADIDFGHHEAVIYGEVVATISTIFDRDTDNMSWRAEGSIEPRSFDCYEEAETYVKSEYMNKIIKLHRGSGRIGDDERGSGRVCQVIEDMGMSIEDTHFQDEIGQQYSVRIHGILAGTIWLSDDDGWTMDGLYFQDDWRPVARELAMLTRRDLVAA